MLQFLESPAPLGSPVGALEALARLGAALLLSLALGLERELRLKPAGMRSHMLVALAAASLSVMTAAMIQVTGGLGATVRTDPVRVIEAVVAGVAFLGAGTIMRGRGGVEGITTGASLWLAGVIGIAAGIGYYLVALYAALFGFVVLYVLGRLEAWLIPPAPGAGPS